MPLLWILSGDSATPYNDIPPAVSQDLQAVIYWPSGKWYVLREVGYTNFRFWAWERDESLIPAKYRAMALLLT